MLMNLKKLLFEVKQIDFLVEIRIAVSVKYPVM